MSEYKQELYERLVNSHQKWKLFVSRYNESESSYKRTVEDLTKNKTRIELDPEVKELLEILQHQQHEQSVGAYERLLTACLEDVIPGFRKIKMELTTERGASALNIFIQKGEDLPYEDAYNGTGGSVSNVLSLGLRAIALVRSGKRKFLVLDEADCWLKPSLIGRFAKVVQQMSEQLGIQILMISHHESHHFDFLPYRLNLKKTDRGLETHWEVGAEEPEWEDGQEGIRSILLENFLSHGNTFFPLSPGLTLLTGDNDIGKSAIIAALRSVFYGEANDTVIQHYKENTSISVDIGNGRLLNWTRKAKKGSPKELYTLMDYSIDPSNPIHQSPGEKGVGVPYWLMEETGIGLIDGLDVQLKKQKEPIFLLNETPSVRAKALSIGDDSSYVQNMLKLSKEELAEARLNIKTGEKLLENFQKTMIYLDGIEENHKDLFEESGPKSLFRKYNRFNVLNKELIELEELESKWEHTILLNQAYSKLEEVEPTKEISIKDNSYLLYLLNKWEVAENNYAVLNNIKDSESPLVPEMPQSHVYINLYDYWSNLNDTNDIYKVLKEVDKINEPNINIKSENLINLLSQWEYFDYKVNELNKIKEVKQIEMQTFNNDIQDIQRIIALWENNNNNNNVLNNEINNLNKEIEEVDLLINKDFPVCPCCLRPWEDSENSTKHEHKF